jgi:hypothetical protein
MSIDLTPIQVHQQFEQQGGSLPPSLGFFPVEIVRDEYVLAFKYGWLWGKNRQEEITAALKLAIELRGLLPDGINDQFAWGYFLQGVTTGLNTRSDIGVEV